jgi:hypothetical protein
MNLYLICIIICLIGSGACMFLHELYSIPDLWHASTISVLAIFWQVPAILIASFYISIAVVFASMYVYDLCAKLASRMGQLSSG